MAFLRAGGGREAPPRPRGRPLQLVGVQADVERRQVEAEQLDPASQRREAAVCEPAAPVLAQAAVDELELGEEATG